MKNLLTSFSLLIMSFFYGAAVAAESGSYQEKSTTITRIEAALIIDGMLDEAVWSEAVMVDDIHEVRPQEYTEASEKTEYFLLYDADYLYVGVKLYYSDVSDIIANTLRQGDTLRADDRVKVILDPFYDRRSGYEFEANANSVRGDGIYKGTQVDRNWSGIWQVKSHYTDYGWSMEFAIPFKTLSFNEEGNWGINLTRDLAKNNEKLGWSSRNRSFDPAVAGTLTGLEGISQGFGLDVVPSLSIRNSNNEITGDSNTEIEPSLDLFYKLTSSLNASLTLNTDFSATEVDNRQVNLTRFSTFFPEKRAFFLRESDIFEFGGIGSEGNNSSYSRPDRENARPFFSRRIGLSASGQPVGLDAGAKLTGRIGEWNLGAMAIRQEEFDGIDATDIFLGRASVNVLEESNLGFILTSGDPRSNLDNTVIGLDYNYRNSRLGNGRRLEANAWYQQSDTDGLNGDDAAFGVRVDMPNGVGWKGGAGAREVQQDFNPAIGYVNRVNVRRYTGEFGYTNRPNGRWVQTMYAGIDAQRVDQIGGPLESENVLLRIAELENSYGDELQIRHNIQKENLLSDFTVSQGVVIPANEYSFSDTEIAIETSRARVVDLSLSVRDGEFYTGDIRSWSSTLNWRPSKHFQSSISYSLDLINLPQGDFDRRLISGTFSTVFSNELSWVNLIQYDNVSNSIGFDSRLHWIPQEGRNVFLVLNQSFVEDPFDGDFNSTETDVTLKIDYTFRF